MYCQRSTEQVELVLKTHPHCLSCTPWMQPCSRYSLVNNKMVLKGEKKMGCLKVGVPLMILLQQLV